MSSTTVCASCGKEEQHEQFVLIGEEMDAADSSNSNSNSDSDDSVSYAYNLYYCSTCVRKCFLCDKNKNSDELYQMYRIACRYIEHKIICTDCVKAHPFVYEFTPFDTSEYYHSPSTIEGVLECPYCSSNIKPNAKTHKIDLFKHAYDECEVTINKVSNYYNQ